MLKKLFVKGIFLSLFASLSFTQDEQVTVIGSLIKGTPIDTGSPISTFDAESITAQNNLNIVELIRMVPGANGMDGESNQFGSNGAEGVSNINMRGLGTNRTLVLINGKRQTTVPIRSGAGRSVNLHDLPMAALSRIEILKEGAAATYGSDAIAGVVNFITDSTFQGLKVNAGAKGFNGAEGEGKEFSLTYGTIVGDDVNFVMSLGHQHKPQIAIKDTDFGIKPFAENTRGGWSTMGNPGTLVYPDAGPAALGGTAFYSDPGCNNGGGLNTSMAALGEEGWADNQYLGFCRYQYTYFDNVQEEQNNSQLWMEFNGDVDGHDWHVEFSYGHTDVPNWATSPSYPPNNPSTNTLPSFNPGFVQLLSDYPDFASALTKEVYGGNGDKVSSIHRVRTRTLASAGNAYGNTNGAEIESREYDTYRFAFQFEGPLAEGIDYSTSLNYSTSTGLTTSTDTQQGKFLASLWGYGGPNCDAEITAKTTSTDNLLPTFKVKSTGAAISVADVLAASRPDNCMYLNVSSNAVYQAMQPRQDGGNRLGVNPDYNAATANNPELIRWLLDKRYTESTSSLLTADFIMQGTMGMLAGGDAAWAFGYERRDYNIETVIPNLPGPTAANARTNIHNGNLYPCEIPSWNENATGAQSRATCASNPVGLFMFLAPTFPEDQNQTVDSLFAEFALPITDEFDMQIALRYEDYGVKDSVDPKLVMRWTPIPALTLRFTGQTTFRAAHPDEMSATRVTALQYVNQAGAFKAVDISGNANLDPEEATTYNFGFVTDFGTDNWTATLDFYDFEFKNPIINENHQQLVNAFASSDAATKAAVASQMYGGVDTLPYDSVTNDFSAASVGRIASNFVNGPETLTNGVDFYVEYETDYANGVVQSGLELNYVAKYDVAAYIKGGVTIAPAFECVGYFNINNTCRSMPDLKGKGFVRYTTDAHSFYGALNYISSYEDRRASLEVAPHTTIDATYTYTWDDAFDISFSVYNLTNENPPYVSNEMNYDPYAHSPLGRYFKAGFTYRMQ